MANERRNWSDLAPEEKAQYFADQGLVAPTAMMIRSRELVGVPEIQQRLLLSTAMSAATRQGRQLRVNPLEVLLNPDGESLGRQISDIFPAFRRRNGR